MGGLNARSGPCFRLLLPPGHQVWGIYEGLFLKKGAPPVFIVASGRGYGGHRCAHTGLGASPGVTGKKKSPVPE